MRDGLGFISGLIWRGFLTIAPWLWLFALTAVWLVMVAVVFLIKGIPQATDEMAREIQDMFFRDVIGRRTIYAPHVYWIARILAILIILFSWVCYSFFTVFVVTRLI